MEKPELEKIIEKLEKLDINQWGWCESTYFGPEFTAKTGGLIFYMHKCENANLLKKNNWYHCLSIKDWEGTTIADYYNKDGKGKNSFTEEKISQFYNDLHKRLKVKRTAEFSDMLDEFLSEKTDYKTSMKKPELKKVISKLERLDIMQWKMDKIYYGSKFTTNANGLTFCLSIDKDYGKFAQSLYYHELIIKNMEGSVRIIYANNKKDSFEEKEITNLYEKLRYHLEKDRDTKVTELINNFLSD